MAVDSVVERFRAWLREHDLPVTPQRLAIAAIVLSSDRQLAAEDVVAELATRGTKAGTATVYRTLDVLVSSGLVATRNTAEGLRRFGPNVEPAQQEQLLCTTCGLVEEFHDRRIDQLATAAATVRGFVQDRHRLTVYGTCGECQRAALPHHDDSLAHSS